MTSLTRALRYGQRLAAATVRWLPRRLAPGRRRDRDRARPLTIALVTQQVTARELKIGRALRLAGQRPLLLARQAPGPAEQAIFTHVAVFHDYTDILEQVKALSVDAIHLFAHGDNLFFLPLAWLAPCPLIYDPYDVWMGMFKTTRASRFLRLELWAERWFVEHAAGLCARSLEPQFLKRQFGYRLPRALIYFPEYCLELPRMPVRAADAEPEIAIVYAGGVWPEDRFPSATHGYAQYLAVGRRLAEFGFHLHIYPANRDPHVPFETFFAAYIAESQVNPYFHLHKPLPYPALMQALTQYDFALHIFGPGIHDQTGQNSRAKVHYSTANKLFDYIEAGLPVIIHDGFHQRGLVRHYGRAIAVQRLDELRSRLPAARQEPYPVHLSATLAFHAPRLRHFYQELLWSLQA